MRAECPLKSQPTKKTPPNSPSLPNKTPPTSKKHAPKIKTTTKMS